MRLLSAMFMVFGTASIALALPNPTVLAVRTPEAVALRRDFVPPTHATGPGGGPGASTASTEATSTSSAAAEHGPPADATRHHGPTATCVPTIVPDKNGYVPPNTCNSLYNYYPSFSAAIAAAIIFGVLTVVQISQAVWYRKPFCWVIIMGCLWELAAYGTRVAGTKNQQDINDLLFFQIFVLLAPLWVNAFCYMVLGRMIHFFLPTHSILGIRASWLSVVFVLLDIVSFIVQLYGTTMTSLTAPEAQILKGTHIYMGGIGLQEFFIIVFLGLGIKFQMEMLKLERNKELPLEKQNWRRMLYTLYAALLFITVRIIFRLIEFSAGPGSNNPLPYHEAYFYVFDAIPMAFAILAMCITHPGMVIFGPDSTFPKSAWRMKRAAKKAERKDEKEMRKQLLLDNKRAETARKNNKGQSGYIEMLSDRERNARGGY